MITVERNLLLFARLLVCGVALTSCTLTAPDYNSLEAQADLSPSPDAIVGMWNCNHPGGGGYDKFSRSELFKSDGTGVLNTGYTRPGAAEATEQTRWTYLGSGLWRVTYDHINLSVECRISQGKLLMKHSPHRLVFTRVAN